MGGHVLHLLCQLLPVWLIQWEEQDSEGYLGLWFRSGWGKKSVLKLRKLTQVAPHPVLTSVRSFKI